jgi:DNA repair protein RecN (Recombination protein N)
LFIFDKKISKMIKHLHITNYVLIDVIDIQFSQNLNIITGETGAGKSIVMGALNLILGDRADATVLVNKEKKCVVEGTFDLLKNNALKNALQQLDIEQDDELIIRREIAANGKSRAFINDTPVTLAQLKQVTSLLVDLHQQFDTLSLSDSNFQQQIIDALANNFALVKAYKINFKQWQLAKKELQTLQQQKQDFEKEKDYNQYLLTELTDLNLKENELETIDAELQILNNAETIKQQLSNFYYTYKEAEQPLLSLIKQQVQQLQHTSKQLSKLEATANRLQQVYVELQDIVSEIEAANDAILFDEKKIETLNDKLTQGYKLLKKHGANTTNQLLLIQADLEQKLLTVLQIDDAIVNKQKDCDALEKQIKEQAIIISNNRKQQQTLVEKNVNELLQKVGMPNAKLKIEIDSHNGLNENGIDAINFLFDANNSQRFEPISKVASGGELSRLMLCIKSLVAKKIELPTLIFDEIDTGISGEAAKQVGIILKDLANDMQIICITHQPQIAAKAFTHLFVYKAVEANAIKTRIKPLSKDESIVNIAKMMSGDNPSEAALLNVKEMMN